MKPALKRIEEALNQIEQSKHTASVQPSPTKNRPFSFEIFRSAPQSDSFLAEISGSPTSKTSTAPQLPKFTTESDRVPLAAQSDREISSPVETPAASTAPELPYLQSDSDSDTLLDAQSDREINSLLEAQTNADDATQLEQVVSQIQDLYYEGPIVNAWLEYYPAAPEPSTEPLREISFERPMETQTVSPGDAGEEMSELSDASYLLCGIDESGQQWSCPCPLDQLPSISMAIARYHKLQQLLQQKHNLEIQLQEMSQEKAEG